MLPMLFNGAMPRWIESLICPPMAAPAPCPTAAPEPSVDTLPWVLLRPGILPFGRTARVMLEPLLIPRMSMSLSSPVAFMISRLGLALAVVG